MSAPVTSGGYEVDQVSVWALGDLVKRAGVDANAFHREFTDVTGGQPGEGFLARIWPKLDEWKADGAWHIRKGATLASRGGAEIHGAGDWYLQMDLRSEALLDWKYYLRNGKKTVGPPKVEKVADPDAAGRFDDAVDIDYHGIDKDKVDNLQGWPDQVEAVAEQILGLGGTVGTFAGWIQRLTGKDIFKEAADAVVGDWQALQKVALVFGDAGQGFRDISANITNGRYGIQQGHRWDGDAGDHCRQWLADYATACQDLGQYFGSRSSAIQGLARTAYHLMQTIKHELASTVDILLLLITRGRIGALRTGKPLAELIGKVAEILGKGGTIWDSLDEKDVLIELAAIAYSLIPHVDKVAILISRLLSIAHEFALAQGILQAIVGTAIAGAYGEPNWPELYDHLGD